MSPLYQFCLSIYFPHLSIQIITKVLPVCHCPTNHIPLPATSFLKGHSPGLPYLQIWPATSYMIYMFLLWPLKRKLQLISFHQLHNMALFWFHVNLSKIYLTLVLCYLVLHSPPFPIFHLCILFPGTPHPLKSSALLLPCNLHLLKSARGCGEGCVSWTVLGLGRGVLVRESKGELLLS